MPKTKRTRNWSVPFAFGALLLSWLLWQFSQFWRRLLRQPRLFHPELLPEPSLELIDQAERIARANVEISIEDRLLPDGSHKLVLNAGRRNFREPWARDFG
ncbi:MAG: hypothetical protein KDE28_25350, partial [Anaerolineales bacterium]|nr:hypothetical protein [Anaerolineales bacterium]